MKQLTNILLFLFLLTGCEKEINPTTPGNLVPKTVDQDPALPSIIINGTLLHSETFGNPADPMIVVLHGGPGLDYRYMLNCKELASDGYFVVFYDQRGTGLSRRERKSSFSREIMLGDLDAVIEHYRTFSQQKIFLLGHSYGAMIATDYIGHYPEKIAGAIMCEPGGLVWQDIKSYVRRTRDYGITSETLNDATYLDQFFTGGEDNQEEADYKFSLMSGGHAGKDNPTGNEDHIPFWRLGSLMNSTMMELGDRDNPDLTENLLNYETQILFIYSERNRAYGLSYAQHVSSAYFSVQLERVDGAGHSMLTFPVGWKNFHPIALEYLNGLK